MMAITMNQEIPINKQVKSSKIVVQKRIETSLGKETMYKLDRTVKIEP